MDQVAIQPTNTLLSHPQVELVHLFDKMKAVRAFVLDVDGVFTNNEVLITEAGELLRTMNVRDGQAIKWAIEKGYRVCIITGGRSAGVINRLSALGISDIYSGQHEKLPVFQQFLSQYQLSPFEVCYMGDDLPDLPPMRKSGLRACPNDAVHEVQAVAEYISPFAGGMGCVRDVVEKVMKIREDWVKY
jgi:3-deoxy-D-manno-octulosonate 8-phosphate phosphatase (KDO 8-P phosphatase)